MLVRDWGVETGAEGSIQPEPVPLDPGGEKTERVVCGVRWGGGRVKEVVVVVRRVVRARESFMVMVCVLEDFMRRFIHGRRCM